MFPSYSEKLSKAQLTKPFLSPANLIHDILLEDIIQGVLKSGERVVQSELAEKFGVSRSPVRDAILRLTDEGYVVRRSRQEYRIYTFNAKDHSDLVQFRFQLESLAIKLAAQRITPREINELLLNLEKLEKATSAQAPAIDKEFHHKIVIASRNRYIIDVYQQYIDRFHFYRMLLHAENQNIKNICRLHSKILQAMINRNSKEAVRYLDEHLQSSRELSTFYICDM